jgi:hypothetical protein
MLPKDRIICAVCKTKFLDDHSNRNFTQKCPRCGIESYWPVGGSLLLTYNVGNGFIFELWLRPYGKGQLCDCYIFAHSSIDSSIVNYHSLMVPPSWEISLPSADEFKSYGHRMVKMLFFQ